MTEEQVQPQAEETGQLEQGVAQAGDEVAGERESQNIATREEELEAEVAALRQQLSSAAQRYRALILAGAPEIPEELVKGETVEEVDASFAAAQQMVAKVRRQLEAAAQAERVPAGAPPRTPPDFGALSPLEKIAHALSRQG